MKKYFVIITLSISLLVCGCCAKRNAVESTHRLEVNASSQHQMQGKSMLLELLNDSLRRMLTQNLEVDLVQKKVIWSAPDSTGKQHPAETVSTEIKGHLHIADSSLSTIRGVRLFSDTASFANTNTLIAEKQNQEKNQTISGRSRWKPWVVVVAVGLILILIANRFS